jgi:hypothetical protein
LPVLRMLVPVVLASLCVAGTAAAQGSKASPEPAKSAARATPADEKAIRAVVLAYLQSLRLMRGVTVEVEAVSGAYARARSVPPPDTYPAFLFVKKTKGRWQVLKGPGTSFEEAELTKLGVPRELWLAP